jgi:hypothetical protein
MNFFLRLPHRSYFSLIICGYDIVCDQRVKFLICIGFNRSDWAFVKIGALLDGWWCDTLWRGKYRQNHHFPARGAA